MNGGDCELGVPTPGECKWKKGPCVLKVLPVLHEMKFNEITEKKRGRRYCIDLQFRIDFKQVPNLAEQPATTL